MGKGFSIDHDAVWARFRELSASQSPERVEVLTEPRPFLARSQRSNGAMAQTAEVLSFPADRSEAPAVRLALASVLATGRQNQLEIARCGVNVRRAAAGLKSLSPREGAPSPSAALAELKRACSACGACRGI